MLRYKFFCCADHVRPRVHIHAYVCGHICNENRYYTVPPADRNENEPSIKHIESDVNAVGVACIFRSKEDY